MRMFLVIAFGLVACLPLVAARASERGKSCLDGFDICIREEGLDRPSLELPSVEATVAPAPKTESGDVSPGSQAPVFHRIVFRDWEAEETDDDFSSEVAIESPVSEISVEREPLPDFDQDLRRLLRLEQEGRMWKAGQR